MNGQLATCIEDPPKEYYEQMAANAVLGLEKDERDERTLKLIRDYRQMGFATIPAEGKAPKHPWGDGQAKSVTDEEIERRVREYSNPNPWTETGMASADEKGRPLWVVDIDSDEALGKFRALGIKHGAYSNTGGGGTHFFFRGRPGERRDSLNLRSVEQDNPEWAIELKAEGAGVVMPGAIHPETGKEYTMGADWEEEIPEAPEELYTLLDEHQGAVQSGSTGGNEPGWEKEILCGVPEGRRSVELTRLCGSWYRKRMSREEIRLLVKGWWQNLPNKNGFPLEEAYRVQDSIERYHKGDSGELVFPLGSIAGVAKDFTDIYSSCLEPPPEFFAMAFLTALGAAINPQAGLERALKSQARMYTLLLGAPGDTRKSTAISQTIALFQYALPSFNTCGGVNSAEGLQKKFKQLEGQKTLLLHLDELATFIHKCKAKGSVLLTVVNSLFHENEVEAHTKDRSIVLEDVYLSFLAASTTDTFQKIWEPSFTAIGFNTRLWMVPGVGHRKHHFPKKVPERDQNFLAGLLSKAVRHSYDHPGLPVTDGADRMWAEWYHGRSDSIHGRRLDHYGNVLMVLLAHSQSSDVIDEEIVDGVIRLVDWQLGARQQNDTIDAEGAVAKMEEKIRRALMRGGKRERALKRTVHYNEAGISGLPDNAG